MMSSLTARFIAAAALAGAALGAASSAHANGSVHFSIGLPGVPVYAEPVPYGPARVQHRTHESWGRHDRRDGYHGPRHWDRDGDGIPNRHDRLHNPRWDVDGDGIPNRHDRFYNPPRRFHDGGRPHGSDHHDRHWR
jgi:hypothetical protein